MKVGTVLAVPVTKVQREGLLTQGIEVVSNDIPAFKAAALANLESEVQYKPVNVYQGKIQQGTIKDIYPDATVWIWCKALSLNNSNDKGGILANNEGQIFNLTPFIQEIETNVGRDGGNFNLVLPPLICEMQDDRWVLKKSSFKRSNKAKDNFYRLDEYVADDNFYFLDEDGSLQRNEFLFHNIISSNDISWVS